MVGVVLKHALQMSDSVEVAAFLAFSGGVMDAYSYLVRGGVFAAFGRKSDQRIV